MPPSCAGASRLRKRMAFFNQAPSFFLSNDANKAGTQAFMWSPLIRASVPAMFCATSPLITTEMLP